MSRIQELFSKKERDVMNVYFTAGFPKLNDTILTMQALQEAGVDMIELGMPYSDPLADGPVIQSSSETALKNGMTIHVLLSQLQNFRKEIHVPVLLMGYMNPILQYGFENFCRDAAAAGVDGLILPDLPIFEFEREYGRIVHQYGLDFVFLVTPETSETRIRKLDQLSTGFIYAVSSSSTTGHHTSISDQSDYFIKLQKMNLTNPVLVGFGIKDRGSFKAACAYSSGAIIGTAFIKALAGNSEIDLKSRVRDFIKSIR